MRVRVGFGMGIVVVAVVWDCDCDSGWGARAGVDSEVVCADVVDGDVDVGGGNCELDIA